MVNRGSEGLREDPGGPWLLQAGPVNRPDGYWVSWDGGWEMGGAAEDDF